MYLTACVSKKRVRVGGREDVKSMTLMVRPLWYDPYAARCEMAEMDTWRVLLLPSANTSKLRRDSDWSGKEENKIMKCNVRRTNRKMELNRSKSTESQSN